MKLKWLCVKCTHTVDDVDKPCTSNKCKPHNLHTYWLCSFIKHKYDDMQTAVLICDKCDKIMCVKCAKEHKHE